ncbi:MAG: nucleoside triphosphate pyrophosphohydrolase [Alphaproteobacteria bacterium PA2]|nr:MAG: nucleoside triphosphate pyrophosphohydrolase [Alphaproteobacteria bacterium PA2]
MQSPTQPETDPMNRLLAIMARLRDRDTGCPWDLEQTFATIAPYTVEEAYEVADAIQREDLTDLREELGDLLFQVVFHSRMAEEQQAFRFEDVVEAICAKMIRRHPHVFGSEGPRSSGEQVAAWDVIKAQERAMKPAKSGLLDDIPQGMPALSRAVKLSKRAASVGFVWPTVDEVLAKLDEEVEELKVEVAADDRAKTRDELGDVLFVVANIARTLDIDPEDALRQSNAKFERRFRFIEDGLRARGRSAADSDLAEMDALWNDAKRAEKAGNP